MTDALIDASGRAEVVGHGPQQRHPQLVGPGEEQRLGGRAPRWLDRSRADASCSASTSARDRGSRRRVRRRLEHEEAHQPPDDEEDRQGERVLRRGRW